MFKKSISAIFTANFLSILGLLPSAQACDLCAIYTSLEAEQFTTGAVRIGVSEQFTSYGKIQKSGNYVENEKNQHMESSITQVFAAYDLSEKMGLQLTLPYINRSYNRVESGERAEGTEAGIGDLSLIARYNLLESKENENIYYLQLFGGLKFATGDASRLGEEGGSDPRGEEDESEDPHSSSNPNDQSEHLKHSIVYSRHGGVDHSQEVSTSIHGHDLALGSGSYDFPIGLNLYAQSGRAFASTSAQYIFRTKGSYDYEYADDLLWNAGLGYYIALCQDYSIAMKALLSGEYKDKDTFNGETEHDTGIGSLFVGPGVVFTAGDWSGELAWDAPLDISNTGTQSVADYKLRAALAYRF